MPIDQNSEQSIMLQIRQEVMDKINLSKEVSDEEVLSVIDQVILTQGQNKYITATQKAAMRAELFNAMRRLDILQDLIEDKDITEIMVNGNKQIFIEKYGNMQKCHHEFESEERLLDVIQQIVTRSNRIVNESTPIVDTRLEDGSRVNIVMRPIALDGPVITIRKFPEKRITMQELIEWGTLSNEAAEWLDIIVKSGYNILISGGTSSGKTTFLNALSGSIPFNERMITIEDSAELQIQSVKNLVRLETRNMNVEGNNEITIRDLIKTSLRMRPDRIIVGEIRGKEALEMLSAMNSGHDGSMCTGHANSCKDMLNRLETMVLMGVDMPVSAIRKQIVSAIDLIIQLGRLRDRSRRVLEVVEVLDIQGGEIRLNPLFQFRETFGQDNDKVLGKLVRTENKLKDTYKLESAGYRAGGI